MILTIRLLSYVLYGPEESYAKEGMFTHEGMVSKNCYAGNPNDAPFMCTFTSLLDGGATKYIFIIGLFLDLKDGEILRLFWKTFMTVVLTYIMMDVVDKMDTTLKSLVGAEDTELKGGLGKAGDAAKGAVKTLGSTGKSVAGVGKEAAKTTYQAAVMAKNVHHGKSPSQGRGGAGGAGKGGSGGAGGGESVGGGGGQTQQRNNQANKSESIS